MKLWGSGNFGKFATANGIDAAINSKFRLPTSPFQSLWTLCDSRSYNPAPFRRQTLPLVCLSCFLS